MARADVSPVVVVGAGGVGIWVAGALRAAHWPVTMVARGERAAVISASGLRIHRRSSELRARVTVAPTIYDAIARQERPIVIVAVKSYDTPAVAAEIAATPNPPLLISFQNGLGNEERLSRAVPSATVIAAVLTTWALSIAPGEIRGGARGGVGIATDSQGVADHSVGVRPGRPATAPPLRPAQPSDEVRDLATALQEGGLAVWQYTDGAALKWSKLLLNLVASGTSAALDWPPGRVLAHPGIRAIELAAWREALQVMSYLGIGPVALPGYRVDWIASAVRRLPDRALAPLVFAAGRGRGDRVPGPLADLRSGRGRTETDVLQGAVARAAAAARVPAPTNLGLARLVGNIASGAAAWDDYRGNPDAVINAVRELGADSGWQPPADTGE